MGRYDRYILSQLLVLFGFFSLVLISVYWINQAVDLFDAILADGQNLRVFLEFSALALPRIMQLVLPISAFVATLYIFNRMISESELVVLQTAGLGPVRLMRPVLIFGLFLAALVAISTHILTPTALTRMNDRSDQVSQDLAGRFLREGEFIHPTQGLTVFIRDVTEIGEFRDVFLQDRTEPGRETTYTASRALLVAGDAGPRLVMFDGAAQARDGITGRLSVVRFDDFTYELAGLISLSTDRARDYRELTTHQLFTADAETAAAFRSSVARMRFEGHDRIVKPLFAMMVPVLAAAAMMVGTFSRFGAWPQIGLAVGMLLPLQMVNNMTGNMAMEDLNALIFAYAQPVCAGAMAAALMAASAQPKSLFRRRSSTQAGVA